jgi:two-component system LytT family response regulator
MIKTIIIEDDLMHSQSLVKILSEHFRNIDIQAVCASVPEAVQKIETLNPDLLFLDIELGP